MPQQNRQQARRVAGAAKKSGRVTRKKVKPSAGRSANVVEMPGTEEVAPPPPPQDDGQFHVDPNRIQAKMRDKLSNAEFQLSLTEAAFDQSQDENRRLKEEVRGLQARIAELEASEEDDEEDEDDDEESEG